jgi:hydrogenase-1 operon protein HyaF
MPLDDIPIIVDASARGVLPDPGLTGNAPVLLREIAEYVRQLLESGESTAIDLSAMPLTPADLEWLRQSLGPGEIVVTLNAEGESTLCETACPGVWWVTHRNEKGAVSSEFIEVALVPELVKAHPEDIKIGLEHLDYLISDLS